MKTSFLTFVIAVGLIIIMMWTLLIKVNNLEEKVADLSTRTDSLSRIDSLYWEHLSKCAFISQDLIEYDKHGYPKIINYPFITRNPKVTP